MFKLYFSPHACCTSVHIILEELKLPFELIYVGKYADAEVKQIFAKVNPLQTVPVLELEDGLVITQSTAILLYLAGNYPKSNLLRVTENSVKTKVIQWLSFVASDVYKAFSQLFLLDKISTSNTNCNKNHGVISHDLLHIDLTKSGCLENSFQAIQSLSTISL